MIEPLENTELDVKPLYVLTNPNAVTDKIIYLFLFIY